MIEANTPETDIEPGFREECRAWLLANCPDQMRDGSVSSEFRCWGGKQWTFSSDEQKVWLERAAAKGWTVPSWPTEYGGDSLTLAQRDIIKEEMLSLGIREPLYSYGITMLGPALLKYGTEGQKSTFLPQIAQGEIRWCQGYSEPNSGSDLASLSTSCEDAGDHWLINGQKVWTSKAHRSDWLFAMVRTEKTEKKHNGITFILIDMSLPGVEVRPIKLISGETTFCEVFLSNVRVPKSYGPDCPAVVGEIGRGWEVGMYLLTHERSSLGGYTLDGRGHEQPIIQNAIDNVGLDEKGQLDNPILRARLATAIIDDAACNSLAEKLNDEISNGIEIGAKSSLVKYSSTQNIKKGYELRMSISDIDSLKYDQDGELPVVTKNWLYSRAYTILGGTSEIQLNIIAKRLLELPSR